MQLLKVGGRTKQEWLGLLAAPGWGNTARLALVEAAFAGEKPFKRSGDPGSCGYRSGGDCARLGVRMHCRLEVGHLTLGHEFASDLMWDDGLCVFGYEGPDISPGCGEPKSAHGTPHATEVSTPYHIAQGEVLHG
jgi:hypothetical protein